MSHVEADPRAGLAWYLVRTKPFSELLATEHLERQGFRVYYPRLENGACPPGRPRRRILPLFPRYLFLGLEAGLQSLGPVTFTRGVSGIVRFGRELAAVPARVVEHLSARADPVSGLHHLGVPSLSPGAPVRVLSGPFEGLDGIFQRRCGDERVVVLLQVMGQSTSVQIDEACVVAHASRRR